MPPIKAVIRPGEESVYVAECVEVAVVTQGPTLDEVMHNLREAVVPKLRRLSGPEAALRLWPAPLFQELDRAGGGTSSVTEFR